MDDRSGWTLDEEAHAGAIGGHAGTHRSQGLAAGDTLGGTRDAAEHPELALDDATAPELLGAPEDGGVAATSAG
ncbi:MAG TPA: hypothetical protein VFY23_01785 [Candidatus Limnocylindrales bacterium]|nr:hypothetical protein [Candidatus Limnocylindrales bacterium]